MFYFIINIILLKIIQNYEMSKFGFLVKTIKLDT